MSKDSFDIINDFQWTLNNSPKARELTPRIKISFFQQKSGQLTESINRWWGDISSIVDNVREGGGMIDAIRSADPYENMYLADPIGALEAPFFSEEYITLAHTWQNNQSLDAVKGVATELPKPGGNIAAKVVSTALPLAQSVPPKTFIEQPKVWGETGPTQTIFSFAIYNTIDPDNNIVKNKKLIDWLIYINSINKAGPVLALPPAICSYEIPGIKYSPVASIALDIKTIGQVTHRNNNNIPDGYQVTMTLLDLLVRSKNMHDRNGPNTSINVFATDSATRAIEQRLKNALNNPRSET